MKKITLILLTVCCLLFCLSSCTTPEDLVAEAMEKTEALDAYEAELKMDIVASGDGVTIEMPMVMDMKIKNANTDDPVIYAKTSMELMGEEVEYEMYMEGEWIYMLQSGVGYKMSADSATNDTEDMEDMLDDLFQDIPESVYEDTKIVKNDDGSKSVALNIPDSIFEETFNDVIESMTNNISGGTDVSDIAISNAKVNITVEDEYISVYEVMFDMSMNVSGSEITANIKETLTIKSIGDAVTVEPMEGYESYIQID